MLQPQYFLHVANILFVLSYSVRDIMSLRVLALCGSLISLPYYYLQPEVLWQPIGWAAVFMVINGYHVWRLWLERRAGRALRGRGEALRPDVLPADPSPVRRPGSARPLGRPGGRRRPGPPGPAGRGGRGAAHRRRRGQDRGARLGAVRGRRDRRRRGVYGRPQLFEVVARENCRVLRVPVAAIKRHAEQDDQLARTLERIAREDLARKLERLIGQAATLSPTPASASQPPVADAVICSEASANLALGPQPDTIGPQRIVRGGRWCTAGLEATPRGVPPA